MNLTDIGQLVQARRQALASDALAYAWVAGVAEVAERTHTPPKMLWKQLTAWAQALQSPRATWA